METTFHIVRADTIAFYFKPDLKEEHRKIHREKARSGWSEVITRDDAIVLPLTRPTEILECIQTYFVDCLRNGTDPRNKDNWDTQLTIPMCVVERIEHQGRLYYPRHALFG